MLCGLENARAALLGSYTTQTGVASPSPVTPILSLRMSVGPSGALCFNLNTCAEMFGVNGFDASLAGTSFTLDASSSGFAAVVATLTNGRTDIFTSTVRFSPTLPAFSGGGTGFIETAFGRSPDFAGQTIGSIVLRINSVSMTAIFFPDPATTPVREIPYTQALVGFTLSVFDTQAAPVQPAIPEPGTFWFGAIGLVLLILRTRTAYRTRS